MRGAGAQVGFFF